MSTPTDNPGPYPGGRARSRGLDRRGFLRLTGVAGALGATGPVLAACSSGQPGGAVGATKGGARIKEYVPGPQPVSGGRYGGTVKVAWSTAPDSFDPAVGENLTAWDALTELVYFGALMAYDKQFGGPVPNLAAAAPVISADGKTLTFRIRPDVKFHNGRAITAQDFKYAWERTLNPKTQSWGASYLASIVGASAITGGKTTSLEGVEVKGDSTLVVHLTAPDFTILNALTQPIAAPVPQEEVDRLGKAWGQTPVGYGPFTIVSYDSAAQTARFERNHDYFYAGLPYLAAVDYLWGVDPQIEMQQLQHGDVDIIGEGIPPSSAGQVLASPTLKPLAHPKASPGNLYLTMYPAGVPAFGSKLVRQAMNWAIDKEALGKITYGTSTPWGAPFPSQLADFPRTFTPYGYDPAKAKSLLAQAGYKHGFAITLSVASSPPFPAIAQVVQQQLGAVGVRVTLNQVDSNALYSLEAAAQRGSSKLQMSTDLWYMVQPTAADEVDALYVTKASSNYCGYSNHEVDKLARQAAADFNQTSRNKLYAQIQQLVGEDAPFIFLASTDFLAGVSTRVNNYQYRAETYSYYDRMWV
ncbi:MAG TPA: ABC transporter substrate-binding protein [Streptosporangiaceae bacterium]